MKTGNVQGESSGKLTQLFETLASTGGTTTTMSHDLRCVHQFMTPWLNKAQYHRQDPL